MVLHLAHRYRDRLHRFISRPRPRPDAFLLGDCPYYAATAESLVQDGDWDIRNQLPGELENHEGFFALSKDGRIVPKHSVLMPILSIPLYLIFGKLGFLLFNLVQLFALIYGMMILADGGSGARLLALAGYISTPFLAYTFNYSPDLFATALMVWSYICAQKKCPIACGLLAGLAVWAKVYLGLLLLPLALVLMPQGSKAMLKCSLAAGFALLPMLAINAHLFGSPLVTGYDRDARIVAEGFTVTEHYSRFNQPILNGLGNLFFDSQIGMLRTAPLWFIWPLGLAVAWRARTLRTRLSLLAMTLTLLLNLVFFARYDEWNASLFGNRFLFPALALGLAMQGSLWEKGIERFSRTQPASSEPIL